MNREQQQRIFYKLNNSMKHLLFFIFLVGSSLGYGQYSLADSLQGGESEERHCFDVTYYDLEVEFFPEEQKIKGKSKIYFTAVDSAKVIQLDLFQNLSISAITFEGKRLNFLREENAVFVEFSRLLLPKRKYSVEVQYNGSPHKALHAPWDGGLVWEKDSLGRPFIGVACEGLGASSWWPNKDFLADKPDSMSMRFIVPKNLECVANGRLVNRKIKDNSTVFEWKVSYPIINYNVTFYIGNYVKITDFYHSGSDSLALNYFVLDYNQQKAVQHFQQVKPMLKIYEDLFGKYPFWKDGYKLVESPYLGMEHQSAIAYGNQFKNGYLGKQIKGVDFDYVIIHESGHEYWGNSVSMKDLADMWIHEAFCTYTEALYVEKMYGNEMMLKYLKNMGRGIENDKPIIPDYNVNQMGSNDMYLKGALMLHHVRVALQNDPLWFSFLKKIQDQYRYKSVETDDILALIQNDLGNEVMPIFYHYLYNPNLPVLYFRADEKLKNTYYLSWKEVEPEFTLTVNVLEKNKITPVKVTTTEQKFIFKKHKIHGVKVQNEFLMFTEINE